jgi:hypothetical protein
VVIDAWVALQALRAAATSEKYRVLNEEGVRRITVEHLMFGSAISGSPAYGGGGALTGNPDSSGVTGPGSTDSYVFNGGDTRLPVNVVIDPPARRTAGECTQAYGRRPVVAVLDTGVRCHPWLDVQAKPGGGYDTEADGFVAVDHDLQKAIHAESELAAAAGDHPRQLIRHPWDTPVTADPLVGELDTDTGHGTFISGIVRQVVPDARVLAIRIMHSDGIVYEGDLICALRLLAKRIADAEEGDPRPPKGGDLAAMVDVVSLSLGYFSESAADVAYSSGLWLVIEELERMGVVVVAAAGNYATSRKFYPAAFAAQPIPAGQVPLISVGALNPNGSRALFSDGGPWVTAAAAGTVMLSTYPTDINGSRSPQLELPAHPASALRAGRAALDLDDYSAGFALWSGTSFSGPLLAAYITRALLAGAAGPVPGLRLDVRGRQAATDRAMAALTSLGWQG